MTTTSKTLTPAIVSIDSEFLPNVPCLLDRSERWNGWACPLFSRCEVERIMWEVTSTTAADGVEARKMVWDGTDVVESYVDGGEETDRWEVVEIDGNQYWGIGAHGWVWQVEEDQTADLTAAVALGRKEILADIKRGVVPASVASFSELHDHVDANEYAGLCDEFIRPWVWDGAPYIQESLHQWLKAGRP